MPSKNYLPGGIILCVVSAMFLWIAYANGFMASSNGKEVPFPWEFFILLGICFFWGVWTVILSVFKLDMQGPLACFAQAIMVAGVATMFFVIAWREKDGWSSNIPFIPDAWNQIIPRLMFALGGVLATIGAVSLLRKMAQRKE